MLSLSKIALFSLISFATLALAITAPEPRSVNARALFTAANVQIVNTMCPVGSSTCVTFELNTRLDLSWQATTKSLSPL